MSTLLPKEHVKRQYILLYIGVALKNACSKKRQHLVLVCTKCQHTPARPVHDGHLEDLLRMVKRSTGRGLI